MNNNWVNDQWNYLDNLDNFDESYDNEIIFIARNIIDNYVEEEHE